MKYKAAVVGCGRISKKHLGLITTELKDDLDLVGVCDLDKNKAVTASQKYNCPSFQSLEKMVQTVHPELVIILSESGNHGKHIFSALQYPIKAIICEKPLCLCMDEANQVVSMANEKNIEVFLVKQNRLNPPVVKLFEAIKNKRLGNLILGSIRVRWCRKQEYYDEASWRGTWNLDGGALTNQASHHVDLLLEAMGPAETVMAYSKKMLANIEAEDTLVAIIKFVNGAMGTLEITTAARPRDLEGSISVLGSLGVVEVAGFAVNKMKTWEVSGKNLSEADLLKINEDPPDVYGYSHYRYYKNVISDLRHGTYAATRAFDGLKSLNLIHAIYQSVETGKEVLVGSEYPESKLGRKKNE